MKHKKEEPHQSKYMESQDLISELLESEEKFQLVIKNSQDPILLVDNINIIDFNESAVQILKGDNQHKLINENILKFFPEFQPDGKKSTEKSKEIKEIALKKGYHRFEWLYRDFKENELFVDVELTSIPYKGKKIFFTVWHDISKQKENEKAILKSEHDFKELFNQAADGILVGVGNGQIINANDSIQELSGYTKEELIGQNINILFEKEELTNQPLRYDLIKKGATVFRERNLVRKDGKKIPIEMNTKVISDGRMQALIRDVSKRKEVEDELKKSKELLEKAETIAGIGRFVYDIPTDSWVSSSVMNLIIGISESYKKDFASWIKIIHPYYQKEMKNYFIKNILRDREQFNKVYEIIRVNDQEERWVNGLAEIEYDSAGQPVRILGTIQDITHHIESEKALKESEEKYKSIFYNSPLGIMHYDSLGVITYCNQHFVDIIGSSREELIGLSMIKDLKDDKLIKSVKQSLKKGISNYEDWYKSVTAEKKTYVRIIFKGIKNTSDEIISGICLVEDITEQFKAKLLLSESEEKFRMLFESANDAIFLMKDEKFIDCNEKTLEIFGCKRNEIIGKSPHNFSPEFQPDGKSSEEEVKKSISAALNGEIHAFEWIHTRLDGTPFNAEVSINSFKIGQETIIQVIIRDVTERNRAIEKIRISEDKFSKIFNSNPDAIILSDIQTGKIFDINEGCTQITGFTKKDAIGKSTVELNIWVNAQDCDSYRNQLIKGEVRNFEFDMRIKSGEIITVLISADVIIIDNEPYVLGIIRNITERKLIERKQKASEEKFRNIFNNTSDLIAIARIDGTIINVNEATLENSGLEFNQIIGRKLVSIVSEDFREEILKRNQRIINGEKLPMIEVEAYNKERELIKLEVYSKLIDYDNEKVILTVARNIQDRKELEKKLIHAVIETEEKERQRLASDLHDEVGPLLSSLKMYINLLSTNKDELKGKYILEQLKILAEESIHNIREVSTALNPYLLNKYGLKIAIESFFEKSKNLMLVQFITNIENNRFESNIEAVYYRIIKELYNNTIKHANADKVEIILNFENQNLLLEYNDNGVGFIIEEKFSDIKKGMGLQNIVNRIKTINGKYHFSTKTEKGFRFELTTKCNIIDTNLNN